MGTYLYNVLSQYGIFGKDCLDLGQLNLESFMGPHDDVNNHSFHESK